MPTTKPKMNIWKRVKDAVTRATPTTPPPHDREVVAWLVLRVKMTTQCHPRGCEFRMPPWPT